MTKIAIYFIRHGEVYNPKNILYGRLPGFPLSEKGREQIKNIAFSLIDKNISAIYTSPILRTKQTALIIGKKLNLKPKVSTLLTETRDITEGMPLVTFQKEVEPRLYSRKYLSLGQESIQSQEERMLKFVHMVLIKHNGQNIIAVSHGDPIMILRAKFEGKTFNYQYKKANYLKKGQSYLLKINNA